MKKLLVLVVIATMVLTSMATSFAAYTDVPTTYPYYEAINKGTAVGLWKGTADGTVFDPYTFYSKEMVATTAVRLAGLEAYTAYNNTKPAFGDADKIPTWAWAYVNVAAAFGLVNGTPNGKGGFNFYNGVNKLISNAEVIAILDRAVGYEVGISTVGKWYGLYLGKAAEVGILNTIGTINPEANAVRGQVAQMAWNAANTKLVTKDSNGVFKPVDPATTLLASKLKATEATVVPTEATSTGFKARPANVQPLQLGDTEYVGTFNKADLGKTINVISVPNSDGKNNVVYYKDVTPADKIVTPTLAAPSIVKDANNVYSVDVKNSTSDYVLSASTVAYLNGTKVTDFATLLQVAPKSITVIVDKNGNTQAVIASNYDFENFQLTAAVDKTAPTLDTVTFNAVTKNIAADAVITNNGAAAAIADLKAVVNKAVVYGRYGANGDIVEIAAYSNSISGVVSKTKAVGGSSVKYYVVLSDGTEVEYNANTMDLVNSVAWDNTNVAGHKPTTNNQVTMVLDKDGVARLVTANSVVQNFGKVTANLPATSATEISVNIKGTATVFPLASGVKYYDKDAVEITSADIDKDEYVYVTLNSEQKVSRVEEFVLADQTSNKANPVEFIDTTNSKIVLKDLTPVAYNSAVVVELKGGAYGTVTDLKKADTFKAYIKNGALYIAVTTEALDVTKYGLFTGYTVDGDVTTITLNVNGTVENIVCNDAVDDITVGTPVKAVINGSDGKIAANNLTAVTVEAEIVVYAVSGSIVYTDAADYSKNFELSGSVLVYTKKSGVYTVATKADIVKDAKVQISKDGGSKAVVVVINK